MFNIGDVVHVRPAFPDELVSRRDENGRLVNPPPSVAMTVETVDNATYQFSAVWIEDTELKRDTYSMNDFYKIK